MTFDLSLGDGAKMATGARYTIVKSTALQMANAGHSHGLIATGALAFAVKVGPWRVAVGSILAQMLLAAGRTV
jgi:hypothetical protein